MVLQLAPPSSANIGQPSGLGQSDAVSGPIEPDVPTYRYFLSGGESLLRLTTASFMGLAGVALVGLSSVLGIAGATYTRVGQFGLTISAAVISPCLALLIACWAGRSSGVQAGLFMVAGWTACSCWIAPDVMLAAAAVSAAILAYGLAELPNRNEVLPRAWAAPVFYSFASLAWLAGGLAPLVAIATVCLGTLFGNGNSKGIHFFGSPFGLAILAVGMAMGFLTTAVVEPNNAAGWFGTSNGHIEPWTRVVCLVVGLVVTWFTVRSGHAASPFGRLLIGWQLGPAVLSAVVWLPTALAVAITMPAWAAVLGVALVGLRRRYRAGRLAFCLTHPCRASRVASASP